MEKPRGIKITNVDKKKQCIIGAVMRSNIRLLAWAWSSMWGMIGVIFTLFWLWRYCT